MISNQSMFNLVLGLSFLFSSCTNKDEFIIVEQQYTLQPSTDVAKRIVDNSDIIVHIYKDSSYRIVEGVVGTEISYLSHTGLAKKLFLVEVDLSTPNISIEASTPNNTAQFGFQKMTDQAKHEDDEGHRVWAGINGDFYNTTNGTPQGILFKEGVAIKTSVSDQINTYFSILKNGKAFIGDQSEFSSIRSEIQEAVGGRVTLVSNGIISSQTSHVLEPRTAIGVSEDGTKVYMLVVDGRKFHYSNGMSYEELAKCLKALGAYDAINLDGGGSSTYFVRTDNDDDSLRFQLRNWPSDNGGVERAVANGLLIIGK